MTTPCPSADVPDPADPWGRIRARLPDYAAQSWLPDGLPRETQAWLDGSKHALRKRGAGRRKTRQAVQDFVQRHHLIWPQQEIIFISDLHADADGLIGSLVASGGAVKTGPADQDLALTDRGARACFVFGGDFFDKGPSNLRLLRVLHHFIQLGPDAHLLAGNHDIRVLFGMATAGQGDDPRNGHFFTRMGSKGVPFLCEIRDTYLRGPDALAGVPDLASCRAQLLPSERWFAEFPVHASGVINPAAIQREMKKIRKKVARLEEHCLEAGLDLREAWAAAAVWRQLFLNPGGAFSWFYERMQLAHRAGSFFFVHAGMDDHLASLVKEQGTGHLNRLFKRQLRTSPFDFYFGPIANSIRTKYRNVDRDLSRSGSQLVRRAGIHAIVHGHRNLHRGQRIALRKQILHFECDITLDRTSRRKEGLSGIGAGATLIHPDGFIAGISSDYDKIKIFEPQTIPAADVLSLAG